MDKLALLEYAANQLLVQGNLEIVESVFSENYMAHTGEKNYKGYRFLKQFSKQIHTAISHIKLEKMVFLSQTQNIITWQRTLSGTHVKNLKGIPASNKQVKWYEIVVSRFHENKIAEEWVISDLAFQLMLKQK